MGVEKRLVNQYDKEGDLIECHGSIADASRKTNIKYKTIHSCVNGVSKTAGGYEWETDYS